MASTAISYGTEVWLAELKRDGWTLTVSERLDPSWPMLREVAADGEVADCSKPAWGEASIGVLATDENGAGVFVPTVDKDAAWRLLQAVEDEVAGVD